MTKQENTNYTEIPDSSKRLKFEVELQVKYIIKTICKGLEVDEIDMNNILNSQFYKDVTNGLIASAEQYKNMEE